MKNKILRNTIFAIVQIFVLSQFATAQNIGFGFKSGIRVATRTEAVLDTEKVIIKPVDELETKDGKDIIHRKLIVFKNNIFTSTAYDIEISRSTEADKFNVILKSGFQPAGSAPVNEVARKAEAEKDPRLRELDLLATAKARAKSLLDKPLTVRNGDIIKFEALEDPYKKYKITDYIKIYDDTKPFAVSFSELQPTKDFTLDDVNLKLEGFEIFINGKSVAKMGGGGYGQSIYFTVPDRGRIIVSPFPRKGVNLQKIGNIIDNRLTFTIGADKYEVISKSTILSNGNWNAWILHDPDYKKISLNPDKAVDPNNIEFGAGDINFFLKESQRLVLSKETVNE